MTMKRILQILGMVFVMLAMTNVGTAQTYTFNPADGATGVSTSPTLTVTFDAPVELVKGKMISVYSDDFSEGYDMFTGRRIPPGSPDSRLIVSGNTLTIDLSGEVLSGNTKFFVFADEGAIKVGGVVWDDLMLDENTYTSIWSFTTGSALSVSSLTPSNGATDVSINPTLEIEFNTDITLGSSGLISIKTGSTTVAIYSTSSNENISVSGNKLIIEPSTLSYSTAYHVEIDNGFIVGFPGITSSSYWSFTTEPAPPFWAGGYPNITQSPTGFTFKGKTDLDGIYYYVVTNSHNPPTIEQIKSGVGALKSGNSTMVADSEFNTSILFDSKFPKGQTYFLHIVTTSNEEKNSSVQTLSIDRLVPFINDALSNPINGHALFEIAEPIVIVFSEPVYDYNNGVISPLSASSFTLKTGGADVPFDFSANESGEEVTLTPQSPLLGNAQYVVTVKALSDAYYNVMTSAVTRTFSTDYLNVWTGSTSNSWNELNNWADNYYVAEKSILIPLSSANYPVINSNITVNNFTVEAGAVVTQTGGDITVLGDFILESSVVTNASYLPKGGTLEVFGETKVHQHIVSSNGLSVVYLMASPTLGTTNNNIGTPYKIKYYDNPTDSWFSINSDAMQPGVGYSVYAENNLVFTGDINRSGTTHSLVRTDGKGYGWNVMGNPFTAGMKWSELDIDLETVENSYWIWNPQNKIYNAFNQEVGIGLGLNGTIPSNHGFLVKLKIGETTGSISFTPDAMVANNANYLKSSSIKSEPHLKISAGDGTYVDQLAVAFVANAAEGVDKHDTEKYFGSGNTLEIFSLEGASRLSINSLPETTDETTVGIGYRTSKAGTYAIRLNENYLPYNEVILTDTKTNTSVDLLNVDSYSFEVDKKETNTTRFKLVFPENIISSAEDQKVTPINDMKIYQKDGDIIVEVLHKDVELSYELVGLSGNIVGRGVLYSGLNNLGKYPAGLYIINSRNSEGVIVSKKLLVYR